MKAIINTLIYDYNTFIENGYCIFDKDIIEVGPMEDFKVKHMKFQGEVINGDGKMLLPGLVNFHTHIYSTLVRGASIPFNPKSFKDILEQLWWRFDAQLDKESIYSSALVYGIESIKNGVTTLIDHHASGLSIGNSLDILKEAVTKELGMRGIFCFETSDRFDLKECISENIRGLHWDDADAKGMFGLHASMSLSESSLNDIMTFVEENPIHIHVAESHEDEIDCVRNYGERVVNRLCAKGLLNKDSILAHCVHIDEEEAKLIQTHDAYVAVNPTSNMNNAVGSYNFELLNKNNIGILVGTDGLGANVAKEWQSLYYAGKAHMRNPVGISFDEMLNYINGSYEYLSRQFGIRIGKIAGAYAADLILVDYKAPTEINEDNAFGHVFYGLFDNLRPSHVWIKGKLLLNGYISIFEEDEIYSHAREESKKLWNRIGVK